MFRQSPGRNQRSKGIKVKHVIQICFLIAICFWLLYQVKHSHDKKKEFDETDAKISVRTQSSNEVPKLGRKDLHPKVEETATTTKKQDEEAEEESVGEEQENKREEEQQQEDQKFEDKEDEGKGVGDDELDEHDQEKSDAEVDQEEEVVEEEKDKEDGDEKESEENEEKDKEDGDEKESEENEEKDKEEGDEKESEENDSEDNNGQLENGSSLDDHDDDDGTAKSRHEAREEQYKADDASSAVTHDTQIVTDENENGDSENSNELPGMNKSANESQVNNTELNRVGENTTDSKAEEREMIENSHPLNTTVNDAADNAASKSGDSSLSSNSTLVGLSNDHPPLVKNTTEVIIGADGSSMQNGTETQSNLSHLENVAVEGTTSGNGSDLQNVSLDQGDKSSLGSSEQEADSKLATSVKTGEANSSSEENSKPDNSTVPIMSEKSINSSIVTEDNPGSSTTGSNNTTKSEKLDTDNGTGRKENDALKTENPEVVQNDPIDTSDSSVAVRTDLETLPEIQTEAAKNEDAAAE